ncbi:hypothetical protein [Paraglaciecola aestuariivivens]
MDNLMRIVLVLMVLSTWVLSGCGGGVSGDNGSDPFGTGQTPEPISLKLGHFDASGQFVEGVIGVTLEPENGVYEISARGSVGLNVAIVNQDLERVLENYEVNFESACVAAGNASLDSNVSTINGEASSTYTDISCAGGAGITDAITATLNIDSQSYSANQEIRIRPEAIGGISFTESASDTIILQGAGDPVLSKTKLTFNVSNDIEQGLSNQQVEFSLSTTVGGLTLSTETAVSDQDGNVFTEVIAGTVPGSVRVTASVQTLSGESISSQSEAIIISTGLPNQRNFTLSTDVLNPEAGQINGVTTNLTVQLADLFNNPVPDNTVVNFTAEGGTVESSCVTQGGSCSVVWTSAEPRPSDNRVTILATAIGHETLFDSNGNNVYDDADGGPLADDNNAASGFGVSQPGETGFVDYSEAWLDENEDGVYQVGERFLDYYKNESFDAADGLFNGVHCQSETLCGQGDAATTLVRKSLVLIMAGSSLDAEVFDNAGQLYASNAPASDRGDISIAKLAKHRFSVNFKDGAGQTPPMGSTLEVETSAGTVVDLGLTTVPNTNQAGGFNTQFAIENTETEDPVTATVLVTMTTPGGFISQVSFTLNLE